MSSVTAVKHPCCATSRSCARVHPCHQSQTTALLQGVCGKCFSLSRIIHFILSSFTSAASEITMGSMMTTATMDEAARFAGLAFLFIKDSSNRTPADSTWDSSMRSKCKHTTRTQPSTAAHMPSASWTMPHTPACTHHTHLSTSPCNRVYWPALTHSLNYLCSCTCIEVCCTRPCEWVSKSSRCVLPSHSCMTNWATQSATNHFIE